MTTTSDPSLETAAGRLAGLAARIDAKWIIIGTISAIVAWLALIPLGFLLWQSLRTPDTAAAPAVTTFANYVEAYTNANTARLFGNSLLFAGGTATFSLLVGGFFAWLNERTNAPLKTLFYAASVVPLIMPGILFTVAWIMLASPQIGLLNTLARGLGAGGPVFDIYSMAGMIWVDGLHYSPMGFLLMTAAFRAMDPSLEESAMMSGASIPQIAFRVTLRLAWPAVLASFLILFVRAIESFEVPALLGLPVGIEVFTSSIYKAIREYPSNVGLASAYAFTLLVIASAGIYFQSRLAGQGGRYSTVTGKGFRPRALDLGPWRLPAAGLLILYMLMVVLLPLFVLVWSSLQKYNAPPSLAALKTVSLDAYFAVFDYPTIARSVWNSAVLSVGAATVVMLMTSVICWITVRTKLPGRWLLDNLASLPMVFPGLVLGLAVMTFYLYFDIGIYGTIWIIFVAYVTRFMPYGLRYAGTSMLQIHRELEESAAMSGASWLMTFRRIILPLLKPGLIAGWIYIVLVSVRELSSSILLYSPGSEVVSVVIWELWQNGQYVELCALGVMMITALFVVVLAAQILGRRFGVKET